MEQLHRPAMIKKITLPEKRSLHVHAGASGKMSATTSPEAQAVMVSTPKTSPHPQSKHPLVSPRACLCSPTTHAGSFRCRLHRGVGGGGVGGGGLAGSVGSGQHEMGKKPSV